jgi:hypothetical protein
MCDLNSSIGSTSGTISLARHVCALARKIWASANIGRGLVEGLSFVVLCTMQITIQVVQ